MPPVIRLMETRVRLPERVVGTELPLTVILSAP